MLILFHQFKFECNEILTKSIYNSVSKVHCSCTDCIWYIQHRDIVLPKEFTDFLELTGIEYTKEAEIYSNGEREGKFNYGGWYHFIGNIVENPKLINSKEFTNFTFPIFDINKNFHLGFRKQKDLCFKELSGYDLVQVEFFVSFDK